LLFPFIATEEADDMPGRVEVVVGIEIQDLVELGSGVTDEQENKIDTLPGESHFAARRGLEPGAE